MATFGGFASQPDIKTFLLSQMADFVEMVRSYSILLRASKDSQVISVAQNQAYPRIGLILSAAKNLDNTYLFSDASDPTNLILLYQNVVNLMISMDSPFSEGITRVAASLTAAILIRSIPLDSDIKNVTSAENIEKGALSDLQEIVKLYTQTKAPTVAVTLGASSLSPNTIYISLGIDKDTLPADWFNINPRDQIARIEELHPTETVKLLNSVTVDPSNLALCWHYVTHTDRDTYTATTTTNNTLSGTTITASTTTLTTSIGSSDPLPAVEGVFPIKNGYTAQDIIELLSDAVNDAMQFYESNVIVSPNIEPTSLSSVNIIKKKLWEFDSSDPTGFYDMKVASFRMLTNLTSLRFDARRLSATINRELIIVRFFTISKVGVALAKYGVSAVYRGDWSASTSYVINDIATVDSYDFIAIANNANSNPPASVNWKPLYDDYDDLINYKSLPSSLDYVEGVTYGLLPNYTFLDKKGPHSVIVDVEKGVVKTAAGSGSKSSSSATPTVKEKDLPIPNTFYFKLTGAPVTGSITCRVSSATMTAVPAWTVSFTDASAEDIALAFLNSLYTRSQASDTLGVLVFPHAVEIVAFQTTDEEVKVVVDIIDVPIGLEIATGTPIEEKTPYKSKPRSVAVDAKTARVASSGSSKPTDIELLNSFSGTASLTQHKKSGGLQFVYDKIDFLETVKKRRTPPW